MKDGFWLVNKKENWTSRDVCNKVSHMFGVKKVGHSGTLDPFATGLLLIACGRATKALAFLDDCKKTYIGKLVLGKKTSTGDITGEIVATKEVKDIEKEKILKVFESFLGDQMQVPPMTSAVHHNGRKLYELAHEGKDVKREARNITIYDLALLDYSNNCIEFKVTVSKGTYIRTLGEDIAEKLGNVGYLEFLKRTQIGSLKVEQSKYIEDLKESDLLDIEDVIKNYMNVVSFEDEITLKKIKHGGKLSLKLFPNKDDLVLLKDGENSPLAIYKKEDGYYHCARNLN